jgi:AraC family transcriptional regulator of adaptative response/methylated-DNA-[protein]-cysteine methyltransferase
MIITKTIKTPIGEMLAGVYENKICLLEFAFPERLLHQLKKLKLLLVCEILSGENSLFEDLETQLAEYFEGKRKEFCLPIFLAGSEFQKKVWSELLKIPYGETHSYESHAKAVGNLKSIRAVAAANGENRIAILVPCHRVIGKNGSLTGYGGGLENKKFLLELERRNSKNKNSLF